MHVLHEGACEDVCAEGECECKAILPSYLLIIQLVSLSQLNAEIEPYFKASVRTMDNALRTVKVCVIQ